KLRNAKVKQTITNGIDSTLTLVVYFLLGRRQLHEMAIAWLVAASLFFYAWWNPVVPGPAGGVADIQLQRSAMLLARCAHRDASAGRCLRSVVGANLAVLGYFKYANFFARQPRMRSPAGTWIPSHVILPLGHLVLHLSARSPTWSMPTRARRASTTSLHYCLFVTFFPQLIAGPIVHHREVMPQFARARAATGFSLREPGSRAHDLRRRAVQEGGDRRQHRARTRRRSSTRPRTARRLTLAEAWSGALAYTFQLYFDFSGYSDMAIGLARHVRRPTAAQLPLAVQGREHHRLLAPLAHDPVAVPARLPLHPARRQPPRARRAATSTCS
ncbi:MAG: hypothetical protein MZV65_17460, partial [Chromatiales bacterium]|nr:hypothetical protein [Chromatiales bacterium]